MCIDWNDICHDLDPMNHTTLLELPVQNDSLLNHIHERTFRRLHELKVVRATNGRIQVTVIANSRFVGQLAEWAVFERIAPEDVDLAICIRRTSPLFKKVQK